MAQFIIDVTCSNLSSAVAAEHTADGPIVHLMEKFAEIVYDVLADMPAWEAADSTDRVDIEAKVGIEAHGEDSGYLRARATIGVPGDSVFQFFTPGTDGRTFIDAFNARLAEIPAAGGDGGWLAGFSQEGGPHVTVEVATIIST